MIHKPLLISTVLSLLLVSVACSRTDVERIREINESAEPSPVSTLAPLPSPVPIATVAPLPSPVPIATVAPLPSPVPIATVAPLPSPVLVATVAPLPSPVPIATVAPLPSPVPIATVVVPLPSPVLVATVAPLPSPVPIATIAPLPSPVPITTIAPLPSPVPIATVAPLPSPVPIATVASPPSPVPIATVASGQLSAEIHAMEVAKGDCIDSTLPEGISITTVVIVECSGPWEYRVLGLFEAGDLDEYPGEGYFESRAYENCDRRYSYFLYPDQESWKLGDRTVSCLQESFGLSVVEPTKLDRLVGANTLTAGECSNDAPETDGTLVELVNCSGPWEYRVLGLFEVGELDEYPGEGYFESRANEDCDRRYSYLLYPIEESWILGDRTVSCLQESFGLSVVDPDKLDRLVGVNTVTAGECFSDAPETDGTFVELVSCSGPWEFRVLGLFEVGDLGEYPGEGYFETRAYENCDRRYSYLLYPHQESWEFGDRTVSCLQESFGLSVVDPTKLDRLVGVNTVTAGECFSDTPETDGTLVELVSCSGDWEYRVLGLFEVDELDEYPGEGYFERRAYENCDRRHSYLLYPIEESWILGDRTVSCLQESFGLSGVDPDKLDRLVGVNTVTAGECFNEAPETGWLLVELVSCSGPWEYRVLEQLKVDELDEYPGEGYFGTLAYEDCDRRHSYLLYPIQESWLLGDRTVSCLQESFGLSVVDPDKLDRLVPVNTANAGECFNEAPETGWLLVELVSCSDPWENQVVRTFIVPWNGEYPGTGYFEQQASKECEGSDYYYEPSPTTWDQGDRVVVCAKANSP